MTEKIFRRYIIEGDVTEKMSNLAKDKENGIKKIYPLLEKFDTIGDIYNDGVFNIAIYKENNFNILEVSKYKIYHPITMDERISELEKLLKIKLEK